jgi:protein phosphatase
VFDFLKKWMGQGRTAGSETLPPPATDITDPDATVPLPELSPRLADENGKLPLPSPTRFTVGLAQHVGQVRTHNEDVLLAFTGELNGLEPMPHIGLFVVADGMGGHSLGERASGIAGRTLSRVVLEHILPSLLADPQADQERPSLTEVMDLAMAEANRAVVEIVPEGGTTLTGALVVGDQLILSHVGDTRAYLISNSQLEQLTRDHSLVQRLKEMGQLTDDEAAVHPQRSVLYRAVGQGEGLEVDVISRRLPPGAILIVCSDGLWSLVPDHILLQIVRQSESIQGACEALVHAANEAGGPDNITVVMVQLPG